MIISVLSDWLKYYKERKSVVFEAYDFAKKAHQNSKRACGELYITHCLRTAKTVKDWGLDEAAIAAAFLHDVIENTSYIINDIQKKFGQEIAFLVDGLTKLKTIGYQKTDEEIKVENLRKFIISLTKDLRVIIIKLANRLDNMRTLKYLPPEKQKTIAWETEDIYAPLAYRLGMQKLSGELEDLTFPYTHPEEFQWLLNEIKEAYPERLEYVQKILPIIEKLLQKEDIKIINIGTRPKRYSSIYKKLLRHDMDLEKIHDLVAVRIIAENISDCYKILGVIHQKWPPLQRRIKDYIARPKLNGYRSLHTTVFCKNNKITEFQIRTQQMHEEAELGIAAHWIYQQAKNAGQKESWIRKFITPKEITWVKQLRNWNKSFSAQSDFIESIKEDFFKDRIFVITPDNDIIDLPVGATPVDFAYRIHSDIGDTCVGAKVNGKIISLDHKLNSGDLVEIITKKGKKPSFDWLYFVKTASAKKRIKNILGIIINKKTEALIAKTEFKIICQDRAGLIKEIGAAFAVNKINITNLKGETDIQGVFFTTTAVCQNLSKQKLEKMMVNLKKIAGAKEVSYKIIS